jgi:hypothetical protein
LSKTKSPFGKYPCLAAGKRYRMVSFHAPPFCYGGENRTPCHTPPVSPAARNSPSAVRGDTTQLAAAVNHQTARKSCIVAIGIAFEYVKEPTRSKRRLASLAALVDRLRPVRRDTVQVTLLESSTASRMASKSKLKWLPALPVGSQQLPRSPRWYTSLDGCPLLLRLNALLKTGFASVILAPTLSAKNAEKGGALWYMWEV